MMSTPVRARTSEGRAASEPGIWKRALMRNIWSENLRMQNQNFYIALKLGCPSPAKMSLAMPVAYDLMLELLHQHMGNYLQSPEKVMATGYVQIPYSLPLRSIQSLCQCGPEVQPPKRHKK